MVERGTGVKNQPGKMILEEPRKPPVAPEVVFGRHAVDYIALSIPCVWCIADCFHDRSDTICGVENTLFGMNTTRYSNANTTNSRRRGGYCIYIRTHLTIDSINSINQTLSRQKNYPAGVHIANPTVESLTSTQCAVLHVVSWRCLFIVLILYKTYTTHCQGSGPQSRLGIRPVGITNVIALMGDVRPTTKSNSLTS